MFSLMIELFSMILYIGLQGMAIAEPDDLFSATTIDLLA